MFNVKKDILLNEDKNLASNKNVWVTLITGIKNETAGDTYASSQAIESITSLSNWLKTQENFKNISDEEIKVMATNLFVANTLKIQRDISKSGHISVFVNSLTDHPDLKDFRADLNNNIKKQVINAAEKVFIWSFFLGAATSPLAYAIILKLL